MPTAQNRPPCARRRARCLPPVAAFLLLASSALAAPAADPPFPAPGEVVHWTIAYSPISLGVDSSIVQGGTVIVDPGVVVVFAAGVQVDVHGTLQVEGTASRPVRLSGASGSELRDFGTTELRFAQVEGLQVRADRLTDCTFGPGSVLGFPYPAISFVFRATAVERCTFAGGALRLQGQVLLRDVTIHPPFDSFLRPQIVGYAVLEDVTVHGAPLELLTADGQDMWVDRVTVLDHTVGAGLILGGARNYLLGEGNVLAGNDVPVAFGWGGAGMLPGCVVPASGNVNDYVRDTNDAFPGGPVRWAELDVPYVITSFRRANGLTIEPGAVLRFLPSSGFIADTGRFMALGTPESPIVFERFYPSQAWSGLVDADRLDHCVVDGADLNAVGGTTTFLNHSEIRNCRVGWNLAPFQSEALYARGTRFLDNETGIRAAGGTTVGLQYPGDPNSFDGNVLAFENADTLGTVPAEQNWWGDPSGPSYTLNPGGAGDAIGGLGAALVDALPFLTAPPDRRNQPPVVRMTAFRDMDALVDPGTRAIFHWQVTSDDAVVSQRLLWSDNTNHETSFQLIAELPGHVRGFEWVVPAPAGVNGNQLFLRVEATDEAGHSSWDELRLSVPTEAIGTATVAITLDPPGPYAIGQDVEVCFQHQGTGGYPDAAYLMLEGDDTFRSLGAVGGSFAPCILSTPRLPDFSTDLARFALAAESGQGDWYYSDYFEIRPAPLLGDPPPTVTLLRPNAGDTYLGGSVVPITWTAADDAPLRSVDLHASFDGGRRWLPIARDLPGDVTGYKWRLPASQGIPDVRVRVIVRDRRFQNASDGGDRSFAIERSDLLLIRG